ncbi:cobalamin biosynthesis protein CobW [Vulcanococcus sp. Clear-D1]|uniref:cobalamin biosynthesis protein CobW n=1 Tax=Vulcanococcus sp. Clear-D1 TaxID=2766970 RepID=UPI001990CD4D|nr:cobalamin biosynthesis protein CobW [Vulcanococcus sp. Clear-D1]MBD1193668.1 cobalamin biosynthesis protein CobW [Vulcanococcus sp. Clear-D1]
MTSATRRLPVTVLTGFLGAGKSTLLRQLLLSSGLRLAVLVNEFGEVGIDGDLIRSCGFCPEDELDGRVVELANGCLCCTVQDEFLPTMQTLLERADQLDGIVVETSGLALPVPLVQAFGWPEIRTRTRVSGVVTVVDGEALAAGSVVGDPAALEAQRLADPNLDHLSSIQELFDDQLDAADLVLLSRADRLESEQIAKLQTQITALVRSGVSVVPMQRGEVPAALLLGLEREEHGAHHNHDHDHDDHHDHDHHDHSHVAMQSAVVRWNGSLDRSRLEAALESQIRTQTLLRLKGRAWLPGKRHPLQIQAVGPRLECWFDSQSPGERPAEDGLELVALGLAVDGAALEHAIQNA